MGIFQKIKKYKWIIKIFFKASSKDRSNLIRGFKAHKKFYHAEGIEVNLKETAKCAMCPNMCRFDCPALQVSKRETYSPANKTRIAYFMGFGRVPMENPSAIKTLYACMNCDACHHWCPMDISAGDCLAEMRSELEKRNLIPSQFTHLQDDITKNGSIFDEKLYSTESEFNVNMPNPQIFYFIGCMSAKHRPEMVRATIGLLKKLNIPFSTQFADRKCCGSPLLEVGYKKVAITLAQHNVNLINNTTAPLVISDCPGCVEMLSKRYPELGVELRPKVIHATQFFMEQLEKGKLTPTVSQNVSVTYHDPCVLARKLETVDAPRKLLAKIPGITIKEAYFHGEETQCCGYGGGYHVSNEAFSNEVGMKRLIQLRKYDPDYILSACPTCEFSFMKAQIATPASKDEKIKDVLEIFADSVGIQY